MEIKSDYFTRVASELNIGPKQVRATVKLLEEGSTVPFISRYRKEVTGNLDELAVASIRDRMLQLKELDKRKEAILKSLTDAGFLTDELSNMIAFAETLGTLEDIYLPFRPKRKTRASIAREKGLQGLADALLDQTRSDISALAANYVNSQKSVHSIEDALAGARDIIAEIISEDIHVRAELRQLFLEKAVFKSKVIPGKEQVGEKYRDYFDWTEPVKSARSYRVLALRRAEKELILSLDLVAPQSESIRLIESIYIKKASEAADQIKLAIVDSFKRLLKPSLETEVRMGVKKKADEEATFVFSQNLKQLLLAAPLGEKSVMAIDPGFRTGCKVVCLDPQGKLLDNCTIFPHSGARGEAEATKTINLLLKKYSIEAVAIGNGTAGRETEAFVKRQNPIAMVVMVNESGASVYSASDVAREEFPDKDITVRGAVSIGRRLTDPLAELVKIEPKSIGVGQYQHDVDQAKLQAKLDDTVMSCVNAVGVELNTASKQILSYISGLGPQIAANIVEFRNKNGAFKSREQLKKVPRLGEKAFEQAAGFLRIRNAVSPLDTSAVHPERYELVGKMATDLNCSVQDLIKTEELRKKIKLADYVSSEVGIPTLTDIISELAKPGRDPREEFEVLVFSEGINSINDLKIGMKLDGIVTNITSFGAFVDIGVHQDGLVHLSELSNRYIKDPNEVVKVQQKVEVRVTDIDVARKRIALSMKNETPAASRSKENLAKNINNKGNDDIQTKLAALKTKFS